MKELMIKETPAKILGLLGCAMFSLAFLFAVSLSNASFNGARQPLPDPFAPSKVVAVIDSTAAGYSRFLSVNFLNPLAAQYSVYEDNLVWLGQQAHLAYFFGLDGYNFHSPLSQQAVTPVAGRVAGAFINLQPAVGQRQETASLGSSFGIDNLFSILIR